MELRKLILLFLPALLTSCSYDLDFTGFVYTPAPVNERFEASVAWNNNQLQRGITIENDTYNVMIAGDSHVGGTTNLNHFFENGIGNSSVMMAIVGDVTTGREEDYELFVSEMNTIENIPLCMVPGNHDLYFGGWESFQKYFGSSCYTFEINTPEASDLYIFLDSGGGTLGSDQLEWLKKILEEERDNYRHAIALTHVNFFRSRFTNSTNILNEEILVLINLFEENRVTLVIQGHDHKRYEEAFGHTSYITLDALKDDNRNASFLKIDIDSNKLSYMFLEI